MSVPLGFGKTLRFKPKLLKDGIAWVAAGAGDCHEIALQAISVTVQQGAVKRQLNAADQCNPAGSKRVSTPDWELVLADGQFALHALKPHSSLKTRMRYALRVGPRRVASGSLSLVRTYRPERLIVVSDQAFQSVCVHGRYQPKWYGSHRRVQDPRRLQAPPRARLANPAAAGGVGPGREPARGVGALGDDDLLGRRPGVGQTAPVAPDHVAAVGAHEPAIHLQAAPVGIARVVPGGLVAVDAHPRLEALQAQAQRAPRLHAVAAEHAGLVGELHAQRGAAPAEAGRRRHGQGGAPGQRDRAAVHASQGVAQ